MDEELDEFEETEEKASLNTWKKILKIVFANKLNFALTVISIGIVGALDIITPMVNSKCLKVFFGENPDFSKTWLYIGIYLAIGILYIIFIYLFIDRAGVMECDAGTKLRDEAFEKLQSLQFSYYDKTQAGWIMARVTSDSRKLSEIISWGLVDISWSIISMSGILIMLFVLYWRLALIVALLSPVVFLISFVFRRIILKSYRKVRKTNSLITGQFNEGLLGSKTTKTLVLEKKRNKEFDELCGTMKKLSIRAVIRSSFFWPLILFVAYIGVGMTLGIGSDFVIKGAIEFSELYLFINYTTMFFDPIMSIARVIGDLQQAQASAERIIGLINHDVEITDSEEVIEKYGTLFEPKKENWEELKGDVLFDNVSFSYIDGVEVLTDFNLDVKKGMSVALVGETGSGKSTIVNLLCRFYEPSKGKVLIDGRDYKERSISWLHSNLGYVLQTPQLFSVSIRDNVKYGKLDATDEEVINALKTVDAWDMVQKLPEGLDTNIGEGGSKLSIGEKQLISFARAIIKDPKILILDEATSSIDTETEYKIQDAINNVMKGRTTFVVAHRLSTIINSDLILVISKGRVIEKGNHKELLKQKGYYYELYKNQFINEGIDASIK